MVSVMESMMYKKRELMAPLTYRRPKRTRRTSESLIVIDRQLKFSEMNTEIIFDLTSPPISIWPTLARTKSELQNNIRCLVAAASSNVQLRMELLGSRISNEEELDNLLGTPEIGLQTLCNAESITKLDDMDTDALLMEVKKIDSSFVPHDDVSAVELRDVLSRVFTTDLRRATDRRKELIQQECLLRNLNTTNTLAKNVASLRVELRKEATLVEEEEAVLKEMRESIADLNQAECLEKLRRLRHSSTQNTLQAVGLPTSGTIQEQEFRLDLLLQIRRKSLLLSCAVQPSELEYDGLVTALKERRIRVPFGASDQFLRHILSNALVREKFMAPIKFPFGVRNLTLDDLNDLPPIALRKMLQQSRGKSAVQDIEVGDRQHLLERLKKTILQQCNDSYVKSIRSVLRDFKWFDKIAELDEEEVVAWTTWFIELEQLMSNQRGENLLENIKLMM